MKLKKFIKSLHFKAILLILALIIFDQISKIWALDYVANKANQNYPIAFVEITNFFNLVIVWNRGISFGMLDNLTNGNHILLALNIVITLIIIYLLAKSNDKLSILSFSFIIGGAIGNLIDRVRLGAVADFLDFHLFGYHWPAFNVADSCVFIGVMILLFVELFSPKTKTSETS